MKVFGVVFLALAAVGLIGCDSDGGKKKTGPEVFEQLEGTLILGEEYNEDGEYASSLLTKLRESCTDKYSEIQNLETYKVMMTEDWFSDQSISFENGGSHHSDSIATDFKLLADNKIQSKVVSDYSTFSITALTEYEVNGDSWSSEIVEILSTQPANLKSMFTNSEARVEEDLFSSCTGDNLKSEFSDRFATFKLKNGKEVFGIHSQWSSTYDNYKCEQWKGEDRTNIVNSKSIDGKVTTTYENFYGVDEINPLKRPCVGESEFFSRYITKTDQGHLLSLSKEEVTSLDYEGENPLKVKKKPNPTCEGTDGEKVTVGTRFLVSCESDPETPESVLVKYCQLNEEGKAVWSEQRAEEEPGGC